MNVKELLKNDSEQMELIALRLKKETTEKIAKIAEVMSKISKKPYSKSKLMRKFIEDGNKVKITVRFRGRELNYAKAGEDLLNKFAEELSEVSNLDKKPSLEGKNMFIMLSSK